jgi:uncharacterized protein (DUF2164 family)
MKRIDFDKRTREALARRLADRLRSELDVEIAPMDSERLLDIVAETTGAQFYNQGLYDARDLIRERAQVMAEAIEDLERTPPR